MGIAQKSVARLHLDYCRELLANRPAKKQDELPKRKYEPTQYPDPYEKPCEYKRMLLNSGGKIPSELQREWQRMGVVV